VLSRWRYKVVAHAEGGRRAASHQDVEEQQNSISQCLVLLQFHRPPVDMPLQQHFFCLMTMSTSFQKAGRLMDGSCSITRRKTSGLLPLFGARRPFPFLVSPADQWDARFSPDGRWVAYSSSESGRFEIYVSPFSNTDVGRPSQTLPKYLVSTGSARAPRWRRDGKEIFYWSDDSHKLMAVPVRAEATSFMVGRAEPLFETRPQYEGSR